MASFVLRLLYDTVVVKEISCKANLLIYHSIYVPTLADGHEVGVVTKRTRLRVRRVVGLCLRDRVRRSDIRRALGVEPLLLRVKRSQLRWFRHVIRMPLAHLPLEAKA